MIKLIIGFIALLVLLSASYIIFVDSNKQQIISKQKEHFYSQLPSYDYSYSYDNVNEYNKECNDFKENPRSFIENNDNFSYFHDESKDNKERMNRRYNTMYNRCYNSNESLSCKDNYIGRIPPTFDENFGQQVINCISNESCDVKKVNDMCVKKGTDCSMYNDKENCNLIKHCNFEDNTCSFKGDLCYKYDNNKEACDSDDFCIYDSKSNICNNKISCYNYYNKNTCNKNKKCKWTGSFCFDNMLNSCGNISVDKCESHADCALMPLNEAEAICVSN